MNPFKKSVSIIIYLINGMRTMSVVINELNNFLFVWKNILRTIFEFEEYLIIEPFVHIYQNTFFL